MATVRYVIDCPACEGDEFGCCVCEHTGKVDTRLVGWPPDVIEENEER